MKNRLILIAVMTMLCGCEPNSRGFVLPQGDVEVGKTTFQTLGCALCHSVGDIAWQGAETEGEVEIPLGGAVTSLKTYGELVTSVINPSHRIARAYLGDKVAVNGESNMRNYNEVMTVRELVDIVQYLQTEYELVTPRAYKYKSF